MERLGSTEPPRKKEGSELAANSIDSVGGVRQRVREGYRGLNWRRRGYLNRIYFLCAAVTASRAAGATSRAAIGTTVLVLLAVTTDWKEEAPCASPLGERKMRRSGPPA